MGIEVRPKGLVQAQLKQACVGEEYWEADFSNYEGPKDARDITIKYLDTLGIMKDKGIGILYGGPNGPGKTTLMMITAKYLIRARWDVYCTSLGEIVEAIKASWDSKEEQESDLLERCRSCDFLFIDDLGKEHRGASGFVQTIFDNIIRQRVNHRRPTFITTNLTKADIERTYGSSVTSLLEGKQRIVLVNGRDYRRTELKEVTKQSLT